MRFFEFFLFIIVFQNLYELHAKVNKESFVELQYTRFLVKSENRLETAYNLVLDYNYQGENYFFDGFVNLNQPYLLASSGDIRRLGYRNQSVIIGKEPYAFSMFEAVTPIANLDPGVYWDPFEPYNSGSFQLSYTLAVEKLSFLFSIVPIYIPSLKFMPENTDKGLVTKNRFVGSYYDSAVIRGKKYILYVYSENEPLLEMLFTHPKFIFIPMPILSMWERQVATDVPIRSSMFSAD